MSDLQDFVSAKAEELGVPGVSAGVLVDGETTIAVHGVTSTENPLPVEDTTLFQFGSTGKTYTATAMMRLVDQGKVDLDAPVRTYVPELRLKDEDVAAQVTVLQLFNHTAGWQGDAMQDTGLGDDALERYVSEMADLEQTSPLGAGVSYNNASLSLAGRVIEKVTGTTYEKAIGDLLLAPLGMGSTYFFPTDIMTRRFVVGHTLKDDGTYTISRPWSIPRGNNPAGGMTADSHDQLTWARFHLGDGRAADGTRLLSEELLKLMQEPTVEMAGSALGDAVGISWLISDHGDTRLVGHGGTTNGQYSDFTMVPARGFAVSSMSNCGPNGPQLNNEVVAWALQHHLGVVQVTPEAEKRSDADLAPYTGRYETIAVLLDIHARDGWLEAVVSYKAETLKTLRESGEDEPEAQPPIALGLLPGGDLYVVPDGPAKGMKGYFTRDDSGAVDGVHLGGRLAARASS